jgi:mitochondrial fission protein ELM1
LLEKGNFSPADAVPRVWVLASPHAGDNTQLTALADALGWPYVVKQLLYNRREPLLRLLSRPALAGVDRDRSSPMLPPWPELVICAGRGAEAVSFWLKQHRNPKLRIVFVGTPWSDPARFDLVITTPQYNLGDAPNILQNPLPVHDMTTAKLEREARRWAGRLAHLPEPRIAVLVGGSSGPYLFTAQSAERLAREASELANWLKGSLLVTTSARTSRQAADVLARSIDAPNFFYRWGDAADDNPLHAFLGLSAYTIVTADSISMLSEATATGRSIAMFDIETGPQAMRAEESSPEHDGRMPPIYWRGKTLDTTMFRLLINYFPPRYSRDLRIVHRRLLADGTVHWLGNEPPQLSREAEPVLANSVARIRGLFGS